MDAIFEGLVSRTGCRTRLAALVLPAIWLLTSSANAATFVVTASEDQPDAAPGDGTCASATRQCTLRAAVEEANALAGFDHIYLSRTGFPGYVLEHGPLELSGEVEISGEEARWAVIDARGASRVVELTPRGGEAVHVRLVAVTLANGFAGASDPHGGAIRIAADPANTLILERSVVRNSRAVGSGGAIFNIGKLDVRRSALQDNVATGEGGGIYNSGVAAVSSTSFESNQAPGGAGFANAAGSAELMNVTFRANSAGTRGGALANAAGANAALTFCTIADNQVGTDAGPGEGGGIYNAGTMQLEATILALNRDLRAPTQSDYAPDCVSEALPGESPRITSLGSLVIERRSC